METAVKDVAIIGAGPIGLEVAIALRHRGLDVLQFDAGQVGQTILRFPSRMRFFSSNERISLGGIPIQSADQSKCTREEYLAHLRTVVMHYELDVRTYERVVHIRKKDGAFLLGTEARTGAHQYQAKQIVIATGGTTRPRALGVPGEFLDHVSHHLDDPHAYFGRRVVVIGGKNSAVEAALRCHHAGARVILSYRGEALPGRVKYWLKPEIEALIRSGDMEGHFRTQPVEITPTHVTLRHLDSGDEMFVPTDFVLLMIGYEADMSVFEMAGVTLEGESRKPVYDPATMETDVPGVFVAGTAIAGTQERFAVYLENCHIHAERIAAAVCGEPPPEDVMPYELPEA